MKHILLFIFLNVFFVFCTVKNQNEDESILINLQYKNEKLQKELLQDAIITSIIVSNTKIPDSFRFVDCLGDTILLKDYVLDTKALILYTGTGFCSSCFQEELLVLNRFVSKFKPHCKVLVLAQNLSTRELFFEKKKNGYKFNLGAIHDISNSDHLIIKNDQPIYFILNNEMMLSKVFVPFKNMKGFSERYFQSILQE